MGGTNLTGRKSLLNLGWVRPSNNGLHQTRRGGAVASRPVVEARLAGEAECSTGPHRNLERGE